MPAPDPDQARAARSGTDPGFAQAWEAHKREFIAATRGAYETADDWLEGMRAAAWAFCRFVCADHDRARSFFVESNFVGEAVQASRDVVMAEYADLVEAGNRSRDGSPVPREVAEAIVGAIWEGVLATVGAGTYDQLPEAIPQALYLTALQYRGPAAAEAELRRGPEDIARYRRGEL